MSLDTLNSLFTWTAVIAALLTAISTVGLWWTGSIIDSRKQQEIAGLHRALAPRSVDAEKREKLISKLIVYEKMKVGFDAKMLDTEAKHFAEQLVGVFKEANWQVIEPIKAELLDDYDGYVNLIFVSSGLVDTNAKLIEAFDALCPILNEAGILCRQGPVREGSISGRFEPGSIYLLIGSKPPTR